MVQNLRTYVLAGMSVLMFMPSGLFAQMTFKKVELRTNYGRAEEGKKGKLIVDGNSIRFVHDKNERDEYFSIPSNTVTDLFYSRVSGRRIKTAIFLTGPLGLFLKGKKHYMTLSFNDGGDIIGAVEFKLDKKNYRGVLRAIEQVAGVELVFDQEGIKDEKETVASRSGGASNDAILEISSDPAGAEIEIDGVFAGSTPRSKRLKPGEYKVKITKSGYKSWERKIKIAAQEEIPLMAELERK